MPAPLLEARDLHCERDERVLFAALSFRLEAGEILRLEGPNGSGKTTLLRSLCGLSTRYTGELLWRGEPLPRVRADYLADMLYIGHAAGIKAVLTPRENLRWSLAARPGARGLGIDAALERVGLYGYEDTPCFMLSAGQQRRVNLARLFLTEASLWLLDEPFTAIDREGVAELERWIIAHAEQGGAVLLTTHHPLDATVAVKRLALGGW